METGGPRVARTSTAYASSSRREVARAWKLDAGRVDAMRMGPLEKLFVNNPVHSRRVARHAVGMLRHTDSRPGQRYLEVGCGNGAAPHRVVRHYQLDVTGVDVDPAQIRAAERRCRGDANVRFLTVDGTQLPFPDEDFHIVATHRATHHMPNWEAAVDEMLRVLKPGGYFVYSDLVLPDVVAFLARVVVFSRGFPTPRTVGALMARHGMSRVHRLHLLIHYQAIWQKTAVAAGAVDAQRRAG